MIATLAEGATAVETGESFQCSFVEYEPEASQGFGSSTRLANSAVLGLDVLTAQRRHSVARRWQRTHRSKRNSPKPTATLLQVLESTSPHTSIRIIIQATAGMEPRLRADIPKNSFLICLNRKDEQALTSMISM